MSQADSVTTTIAPGVANVPAAPQSSPSPLYLITIEMPFDLGTVSGQAEISASPEDGLSWISDLWVASDTSDRPIRVRYHDPAFDQIKEAVERDHASRIDELVDRELAARELCEGRNA